MNVTQYHHEGGEWHPALPTDSTAQLLIGFGGRGLAEDRDLSANIKSAFPKADHIGCSTSGEILADEVYDDSMVVTAIEFSGTPINVVACNASEYDDSYKVGKALAEKLSFDGLKYVLVLSNGHCVNGTDLVSGLSDTLPEDTLITGGLAGDGERFEETVVWHNDSVVPEKVVICGFYGDHISLGHGTLGGWATFGPERIITKSDANVLYELDNQPALDLYKRYLGDVAKELPSSALRFPLSLQMPGESDCVVRTILGISEEDKSMTFAGTMPEGATARLMKANIDSLVDGATGAANGAKTSLNDNNAQLALLISCVGRRLVLGQRVFEELETVNEVLGDACPSCGFYSYGEISPLLDSVQCRLHNQTMTITTFSESPS